MATPERSPAEIAAVSVETLIALFDRAARKLRLMIATNVRTGAIRSAQIRERQLAQAMLVLAMLRRETHGLATAAILAAAREGVLWVESARGASPALLPRFSGLDLPAIHALAFATEQKLDGAIKTIGRSIEDVYRRVGLEEVSTGVITGAPRRETSEAIRRRLVEEGMTAFVDRAGRRWKLDVYAGMVARTTSREAASAGVLERMRDAGLDLVTWSEHANPCKLCAKYDGRTFSISGRSDRFSRLIVIPPAHPNSVIAGTRLRPDGVVRGGVSARWNGPLVHLATASGIGLAIGPNHPVLTALGWVAAKFLREGDDVIRRTRPKRLADAGANKDLDEREALVEDVFGALATNRGSALIPASGDYLHGDGTFCEGEIEVVGTECPLLDEADLALREELRESSLMGADPELPGFASGGASTLRLEGVLGPPAVAGTLADAHPALFEAPSQRGLAARETLGEVLSRLAGEVALDKLVEVRNIDSWRGQAFDFETTSGAYFADGLYVSNCRHVLTPARII